jgi:hypothetical protein
MSRVSYTSIYESCLIGAISLLLTYPDCFAGRQFFPVSGQQHSLHLHVQRELQLQRVELHLTCLPPSSSSAAHGHMGRVVQHASNVSRHPVTLRRHEARAQNTF